MANISRFDPFSEVTRFDPFRDFDSALRLPRSLWRGMPEAPEIKIDVSEDDKAFRVKAEIPGVRKEDINISIDGNRVLISAEVKQEKEEKKGETVLRSERYYGTQYRGFTLQQDVDQSKAEAKYQDGILELVLPKKETTSAKRLEIR
jgi:HSP20 family protein